jgi:Flp pilus assembly pilin Flp
MFINLRIPALGRAPWLKAFLCDTRANVSVEYIVLVATIAIVSIPAAAVTGKAIVESYTITRDILFYPVP